MNFTAFQDYRAALLRESPGVLDCAETNLYRALARFALPPTEAPTATVHRCHLASEWAQCFALDPACSSRALVSAGVRDSLARLFVHLASRRAKLWLPEDNYPVYGDLATTAGLRFHTFPTLPEAVWPDDEPASECEVLLVTNPMKPRGRWLSDDDVSALSAWLAKSPQRRLMLDAVYTFHTSFDKATLRLLATEQVILLHSVTNGWLHPRLFGIALVPAQDASALTSAFRAEPPSQTSLARTRQMLGASSDVPAMIARELTSARERLNAGWPEQCPALWSVDAPGYFTPITLPWRRLLDEHHILGLPATTFGSGRADITILSSLSFLP